MVDRGMRIYVAGPYTGDEEANVARAVDIAVQLMARGHNVYVPHLSHYIDARARERGVELSWAYWMSMVGEWLLACEAIFYFAPSRGADIELDVARTAGLTVFTAIDDVPRVEPYAFDLGRAIIERAIDRSENSPT